MLVLRPRGDGWFEITHRSGDVLRLRLVAGEQGVPPGLNIAFDDDARNFNVARPGQRSEAAR